LRGSPAAASARSITSINRSTGRLPIAPRVRATNTSIAGTSRTGSRLSSPAATCGEAVTSGSTTSIDPDSATTRFDRRSSMRMPTLRGTSDGQPSRTRPASPIRGTENGKASTSARATRFA